MARRNIPIRSLMNTVEQVINFCPVADPDYIKVDFDANGVAVADEIGSLDASIIPGIGRNVTATLDNVGASTADDAVPGGVCGPPPLVPVTHPPCPSQQLLFALYESRPKKPSPA